MMDEEGTVAISYLGTDPPDSKVGANETKASAHACTYPLLHLRVYDCTITRLVCPCMYLCMSTQSSIVFVIMCANFVANYLVVLGNANH